MTDSNDTGETCKVCGVAIAHEVETYATYWVDADGADLVCGDGGYHDHAPAVWPPAAIAARTIAAANMRRQGGLR